MDKSTCMYAGLENSQNYFQNFDKNFFKKFSAAQNCLNLYFFACFCRKWPGPKNVSWKFFWSESNQNYSKGIFKWKSRFRKNFPIMTFLWGHSRFFEKWGSLAQKYLPKYRRIQISQRLLKVDECMIALKIHKNIYQERVKIFLAKISFDPKFSKKLYI